MQMLLKGCRRCGGDLIPDRTDREGRSLTCLQCGHEAHIIPATAQVHRAETRQTSTRAA